MNDAMRRDILERAAGRCEYCRLPLALDPLMWHVDHVVPRQHGGLSVLANLAAACCRCNRGKGTNLTGIDPVTGSLTRLFDPRNQSWAERFRFEGPQIVGVSPTGRVTVLLMNMNDAPRLLLRATLMAEGDM